MADEFRGGTSAGGVTGDVTGLELAKVCQKSYVRVTGHNRGSTLLATAVASTSANLDTTSCSSSIATAHTPLCSTLAGMQWASNKSTCVKDTLSSCTSTG